MTILRNLAFYLVFYGGSVLYVGAALFSLRAPARLGAICAGWSVWHRRCARALLGISIRVEGHYAEANALYVVKHESFFEAIDMPALFDRPAPFAKKELFDIPGWGRAARTFGVIEVARDQGARALRAMLKDARARAQQGRPLVLFPEGTRVPHGTRPELKAGFAGLYKLLALPVVPVAVDSGPLYHRRWKKPGTITYRFGEPISPGLPRAEAEARVLEAINALNS